MGLVIRYNILENIYVDYSINIDIVDFKFCLIDCGNFYDFLSENNIKNENSSYFDIFEI